MAFAEKLMKDGTKSASETPLSKALENFRKGHNTENMSPSHRIGFKNYLAKNSNAEIFNSCSIEDQNYLIKEFISNHDLH